MKKTSFGYTLMELLVSIAVLGVILGLGLAQWNKHQSREKLRSETQKVMTWLRKMHTQALQGEKPDSACNILDKYEISQDGNTLNAKAICLDANGDPVIPEVTVDSVTVDSDIGLSLSKTFNFLSNTGVTEESNDVEVELTYVGNTRKVYISYSGKITWE